MIDEADVAELSFEDALKRLETIVARLESGDASLDESITLGQDGRPTGVQPFDAG
jgi:exodeoxyribonuclease VII small subunit